MKVWDYTGIGSVSFEKDYELGYIVENSVIQSSLWNRLKELPEVDTYFQTHVKHIQLPSEDGDMVRIETDGSNFSTKLLVIILFLNSNKSSKIFRLDQMEEIPL